MSLDHHMWNTSTTATPVRDSIVSKFGRRKLWYLRYSYIGNTDKWWLQYLKMSNRKEKQLNKNSPHWNTKCSRILVRKYGCVRKKDSAYPMQPDTNYGINVPLINSFLTRKSKTVYDTEGRAILKFPLPVNKIVHSYFLVYFIKLYRTLNFIWACRQPKCTLENGSNIVSYPAIYLTA